MSRRGIQLAATLGLLVGLAAAYWFHFRSGIEWSVDSLRDAIESAGVVGPIVFASLVALRPFLLLPSWVFLVAGGILFGTLWGTLWSSLGTLAGALWVYGVARGLARDAVEQRLSGAIERVDGYIGRHGAVWLAAYTAMPATPMTPAFAAVGLSSLRPLPFALAAFFNDTATTEIYTFFAASVVTGDTRQILVASALLAVALLAGLLGRRWWLGGTPEGEDQAGG
jgi:uncharacterized membrane protein YdjX (TVP38/TMEM64 family)